MKQPEKMHAVNMRSEGRGWIVWTDLTIDQMITINGIVEATETGLDNKYIVYLDARYDPKEVARAMEELAGEDDV